ncbi:hypothetical protein [Nocardia iowensis]|uniref:Uncharacterized protein n=1 Tax=Nocardia iowensis TaxID=204891 RepID=A0ABX8RTW5_NOCIO|nr:hypothetical protein [Nocardia iowensis]QXN93028.1 hypothetical protein KV110_07945 [Nocardia iowensis]
MFHKTAIAAVTGLFAVATTLAVAAGTANATPQQGPAGGTELVQQFVPVAGPSATDSDGGEGGNGGKGKDDKGKGKGKGRGGKGKDKQSVEEKVAAALSSALRDLIMPPNGGADKGPLDIPISTWLDMFLGPEPGKDDSEPDSEAEFIRPN